MNTRNGPTRRRLLQTGVGAGLGLLAPSIIGRAAYAQSGDMPSIEILNSAGGLGQVMQIVMAEQGFAEDVGVKINYTNIASGAQIVSGLMGGSGDACMWSGFPQLLPAIENGAKLKIVAGSSMVPLLGVFSSKPEVKTLQDLVGRNVGTGAPGSLLQAGLIALLRKYNVDETKVNFVNLGSSTAVFRATSEGVVDAGLGEVDVTGQMEEFGVHLLENGGIWDELPEFTWQASYTTADTIANKRDGLVRCMAAHAKLYRFLEGPDSWEAFRDARNTFAGKDDSKRAQTYWDFIQSRKPFAENLVIDEGRLEFVQELNISLGTQKAKVPYDVVTDMSLAVEANALIA